MRSTTREVSGHHPEKTLQPRLWVTCGSTVLWNCTDYNLGESPIRRTSTRTWSPIVVGRRDSKPEDVCSNDPHWRSRMGPSLNFVRFVFETMDDRYEIGGIRRCDGTFRESTWRALWICLFDVARTFVCYQFTINPLIPNHRLIIIIKHREPM